MTVVGLPGRTSNVASKFAIQGYTEGLRAELAASGVRVLVATPGYIQTNLSQSAVMGDGSVYGKEDETTANGSFCMAENAEAVIRRHSTHSRFCFSEGSNANDVAVDILNAVANGRANVIVAATISMKLARWIRFLFPSVWNRILAVRYDNSKKQNKSWAKTNLQH
jgi:short-subunit dehydrogenase